MSELIKFYTDVLSVANLIPDDKGYVRASTKDKPIITVESRLLVLPLREQLKSLSADKEVFHPLGEISHLRMSKALEVFTYRINGALNTRFAEIAFGLKTFCSSPAKQINITKAQLEVTRNIEYEADVRKDDGPDSFLTFLLGQLKNNPSEAFVHITLARGGFYKGNKKSRVGIVTFPFYKKLKEAEDKTKKESEIQNLSKKQIKLLIQIYEGVFPGLDVPEEYNFPYETGIAPFFTTLMQTAAGLADAMNVVLEAFQNEDGFSELEPINLEWRPLFDNREKLQQLSKHAPNTEINPEVEGKQPTAPAAQPAQPAVVTPVQPATPDIPYAGPVVPQQPSYQVPQVQQQPTQQHPGRNQPATAGRPRVAYEEWAKKSAQPSQMGANANMMAAIQRYNQAYEQYYNGHLQRYGVAPANMPHPSSIPRGSLAPWFHGAPPMPQIPGMPQQGYQQQVGWGQPQQPQVLFDQYGRQVMVAPQQMPSYPQGQQMPMTNAWGQPIQPQQQTGWVQPQQQTGWNTNQTSGSGSIMPGTL